MAWWVAVLFSLLITTVLADEELPEPYPPGCWGPRWGTKRISAMMALDHFERRAATLDTSKGNEADLGKFPHTYEVFPPRETAPPPLEQQGEKLQGKHSSYVSSILRDTYSGWNGRLYIVPKPLESFSVYPPRDGCGNGAFTVLESSKGKKCHVATNAGFFYTRVPGFPCHGNLVSDGQKEQLTNETNASFGITKNGTIVVGYLSHEDIKAFDFQQLVAGVIWLVRNGTKYIDNSARYEDLETQETGWPRFRDVRTSRLALGHDKDGRLVMMSIEKASYGADLNILADLLIKANVVNAINLDGGGSVGVFEDGVMVGTPTDSCSNIGPNGSKEGLALPLSQVCARHVTSITCIHDPRSEEEKGEDKGGKSLATFLAIILGFACALLLWIFFYLKCSSSTTPEGGDEGLPQYNRPNVIKRLRKKGSRKRGDYSAIEGLMMGKMSTSYELSSSEQVPEERIEVVNAEATASGEMAVSGDGYIEDEEEETGGAPLTLEP